jgi:hypothetical protein
MDYPPLLNEARGDYLSGQIQQAKDRLLAAKQLVNRRQNELDTLKRQQNAVGSRRQKRIVELFSEA